MKLASIIHNNTIQSLPKLISSFLRTWPATCPKWVHFKLAPLRFPPPNLVGCNCRRRYSLVISCLKKTEQGEESSTAEEKTQGSGNYVSSVRTVSLCVSAGAEFVSGQFICIRPDIQIFQSTTYVSEPGALIWNCWCHYLQIVYHTAGNSMQRFEAVNLLLAGILLYSSFKPSIGVILGFIGLKMIPDCFGYDVSTEASLGVVATCLSAGVLLSLVKKSDQ
ncbi:hypothetical protein K7X08_007187 [Anisodus acutangulus]|uniref:Uncharacterized protein n=1 Tax=Anisodus acutangulus TaxID=402998 RepID=A0A9Q1LFB6_9SOLA|nr:hypothetical protein K7X08_007187 [Anisodus acutangulus]